MPAMCRCGSNTASARSARDASTPQACTNAQNVYVPVYTIGFSVPSDPIDSAGQTLLQNRAANPSQVFVANTSDDLITAFNQIAASIGALRLTK